MIILTIRTDKPEAEIGLYDAQTQLAYQTWAAHRQLAETIHTKIAALLEDQGKQLSGLDGIVAYKGPGSFTGLRIGLSVANGLAAGLGIPIVGIEGEKGWLEKGLADLQNGANDQIVIPKYGAPVHITQQKR